MVYRADSTSHLISKASAAQDGDGLDTLYRRYRLLIRKHVERRFGGGPPDPEDAVQAAFERFAAVEDRSAVHDPLSFLRRSASNFVLDYHRAQKVRTRHVRQEAALATGGDDLDAERVLSGRERLVILDRVIRAMDDRRREVLIMHRIHGLSSAEIARRLQCSPTLVKMRLAEAVALCEQAMREADGEP